jgi:dTDP-4-amino-4,6-dideoxygalactose transaminase
MKKILVTQPSMPPFEEYSAMIKPLWESKWLTNMGELHVRFEKELEARTGCPHITLLTNGHMALELSLQALGLPKGSEVITTPFTFVSTTHAIVRNGLIPVFCDIKESDYTIDEEKIEALITDRTSAIMPVHVYGNLCAVEKIRQIAERHHLKVVYDAAHAFDVQYKGRNCAQFGDVSMFSFHATKVFNTIEGGAVAYRDEEFGHQLYMLKNFGILDEETIAGIGANAKMNEFQAAMGLCNLKHLDASIARRRLVSDRYHELLQDVRGVKLCTQPADVRANYAYMPVVFRPEEFGCGRDEVMARLIAENIYPRKYFYPITNECRCYQGLFPIQETPIAMRISRQVLTLPIYENLDLADVDRICGIIRSLQAEKAK